MIFLDRIRIQETNWIRILDQDPSVIFHLFSIRNIFPLYFLEDPQSDCTYTYVRTIDVTTLRAD